MLYAITHTTIYEYSEPAAVGHNVLHVQPRAHPRQVLFDCALEIDPVPAVTRRLADYFGNPVCYFSVQQPHRRLALTARTRVEVSPPTPFDPDRSPPWHEVPALLRAGGTPDGRDAYGFTFESPYVPCAGGVAAYGAASFAAGRPLLDAVLDLTRRIHREFRYDPR